MIRGRNSRMSRMRRIRRRRRIRRMRRIRRIGMREGIRMKYYVVFSKGLNDKRRS